MKTLNEQTAKRAFKRLAKKCAAHQKRYGSIDIEIQEKYNDFQGHLFTQYGIDDLGFIFD